jgi:hypothetical protein
MRVPSLVRRLLVIGMVAGAAAGYRRYRLNRAPQPSWD